MSHHKQDSPFTKENKKRRRRIWLALKNAGIPKSDVRVIVQGSIGVKLIHEPSGLVTQSLHANDSTSNLIVAALRLAAAIEDRERSQ